MLTTKKPLERGAKASGGKLLTDFGGIAEGNREKQRGDGKGQNQDVGEALHGEFEG